MAADAEARGELLARARLVRLSADRHVFHAGDRCESFLILVSGSVRVQLTSALGREVTLYRLGPGGSCLLTTSCLMSSEHYPADAIAETDVEAIAIPLTGFQRALDASATFRRFVFDGFSSRLTNVIQKLDELAFTSIDTRLAQALLGIESSGRETITHQGLAVELGTAREVVSRHLKVFERRGWVRLGRGRVAVTNRAALERIATAV